MALLMIHLVLPPVIAEMCNQDKTGRLERTLRSYSTLYGVPSLLFLTVFMLLGGQILALVCGDCYRNGAGIRILLSAAKVAAFC
jgi:O-antigen/teichoic acid export membrane protein